MKNGILSLFKCHSNQTALIKLIKITSILCCLKIYLGWSRLPAIVSNTGYWILVKYILWGRRLKRKLDFVFSPWSVHHCEALWKQEEKMVWGLFNWFTHIQRWVKYVISGKKYLLILMDSFHFSWSHIKGVFQGTVHFTYMFLNSCDHFTGDKF